jgi:hypothetical protein
MKLPRSKLRESTPVIECKGSTGYEKPASSKISILTESGSKNFESPTLYQELLGFRWWDSSGVSDDLKLCGSVDATKNLLDASHNRVTHHVLTAMGTLKNGQPLKNDNR